MRRVVLVLSLGALLGAAPAWSAELTLRADHRVARYDDLVRFQGTLPTPEPQQVALVRDGVVVGSTTARAGAFTFDLRVRFAGTYVARTSATQSAPVRVRVKPLFRSRVVGERRLGHRVLVVGRLLPVRAGRLLFARSRVRVRGDGRFRIRLDTSSGPLVGGKIRLRPKAGYVRVGRRIRVRLAQPRLQHGSHGPAVRVLKERLWELGYALPSIDAGFGYRTYEAVLAFQKVHRLARTGRIGTGLWRALWRTNRPRPRVRRGDYLEVDKSRQVLMEVRGGNVVRVIHVSTGATGNTPVGTWRVYREVLGWDWVLYHPMYFLRGFAIHGYPSVPPWPASHGCVRVPMWIATALRERWGYGSIVRVYA
jgi:N-acetylmuramoyl-L-alanine amidase